MPTLQAMHRALAKHPMLQVELFLLLDELVHTELCCMNAFIGVRRYGIREKQLVREDDFASSIQIGIDHFPRSALSPLEAQGRGFTHGNEKNHFCASNKSCASEAVVHGRRCYRAR